MTCLMFPFGDASWHPDVVEAAAVRNVSGAAAPLVAPAAATTSRHPSASAQRMPSFPRLDMCSLPFWVVERVQPTPFAHARQRAGGKDPFAVGLQAARACRAEEAARLGLHEAHDLVHAVERRLRGVPRLLGASGDQSLQL